MSQTYRIVDIAELLDVSPHTVRLYRGSGRIPGPVPITDDGRMYWDQDAYNIIRALGAQPKGTYPITPNIEARNTRPAQVQFRANRIMDPLLDRTLAGQNISATCRHIVETYLELMATIDALNEKPRTETYISDVLTEALNLYDADQQRRKDAQR